MLYEGKQACENEDLTCLQLAEIFGGIVNRWGTPPQEILQPIGPLDTLGYPAGGLQSPPDSNQGFVPFA